MERRRHEHHSSAVEGAHRQPHHLVLVPGGRRHRLLLRLRAGIGRRGRGLPAAHRKGVHDAPMGPTGSGNAASTIRARRKSPMFSRAIAVAAHPSTTSCRTGKYWVANQWGSHQFDLTRYPDLRGMIQYHPHHVQRPLHDLGVAQVLPHHRELHCAERQGLRLHTETSPRAKRTSLAIISLSMMPSIPARGPCTGRK